MTYQDHSLNGQKSVQTASKRAFFWRRTFAVSNFKNSEMSKESCTLSLFKNFHKLSVFWAARKQLLMGSAPKRVGKVTKNIVSIGRQFLTEMELYFRQFPIEETATSVRSGARFCYMKQQNFNRLGLAVPLLFQCTPAKVCKSNLKYWTWGTETD